MRPSDLTKQVHRALKEEWDRLKEQEGKKLAREFKNDLRTRIKLQAFTSWVPLSPEYKKRKEKLGLDPRTLMARGDYVNSIRIRRTTENTYVVDVPQTVKHYSGLTYKELAAVHEYGSKKAHIPARPHWRPTIRRYQARKRELEKAMQEKLVQRVEKRVKASLSGGS